MSIKFFGRHISDFVYGANDGIITTFAVVSGAAGAALESGTIIILGLASLVADGFSMGSSKILSENSHRAYKRSQGEEVALESPIIGGVLTFIAFIVAGSLPLIPFFVGVPIEKQFWVSAIATCFALFFVGGIRSFVTRRSFMMSAIEMLFIGGLAAAIAYFVGWAVQTMLL